MHRHCRRPRPARPRQCWYQLLATGGVVSVALTAFVQLTRRNRHTTLVAIFVRLLAIATVALANWNRPTQSGTSRTRYRHKLLVAIGITRLSTPCLHRDRWPPARPDPRHDRGAQRDPQLRDRARPHYHGGRQARGRLLAPRHEDRPLDAGDHALLPGRLDHPYRQAAPGQVAVKSGGAFHLSRGQRACAPDPSAG